MKLSTIIPALAIVASVALAPASALAYYPYTWFTGTSYYTGPDYFVGAGGFATGPIDGGYVPANYYGSSNCSAQYGCGSIGYNAMTGQWTTGGQTYGQQFVPQYGYNMQGAQSYGGSNTGYNTGYGSSGCYPYVPSSVCNTISQYGGNSSYGYNSGYNSGYSYGY